MFSDHVAHAFTSMKTESNASFEEASASSIVSDVFDVFFLIEIFDEFLFSKYFFSSLRKMLSCPFGSIFHHCLCFQSSDPSCVDS